MADKITMCNNVLFDDILEELSKKYHLPIECVMAELLDYFHKSSNGIKEDFFIDYFENKYNNPNETIKYQFKALESNMVDLEFNIQRLFSLHKCNKDQIDFLLSTLKTKEH